MFKTFDDFVNLACRTYHFPEGEVRSILQGRLHRFGITKKALVCYINWAGGDCLLQKEIGRQLNITQSTVSGHFARIKSVWPYLFEFGEKVPVHWTKHRSQWGTKNGKIMFSLDEIDESKIVRKF